VLALIDTCFDLKIDWDGLKEKSAWLPPKDCMLMVGAAVLVVKLAARELFPEDAATLA